GRTSSRPGASTRPPSGQLGPRPRSARPSRRFTRSPPPSAATSRDRPNRLLLGVPVEELVDIGVVDAGEAAGRERGQDVRVRASRRPRVAFPPFGQGGGRPGA